MTEVIGFLMEPFVAFLIASICVMAYAAARHDRRQD